MRCFFVFCIGLLLLSSVASAQFEMEEDTLPDNVLLEKQWSLGGIVHTNGWGLKFRKGKNVTALRQRMWEIEWATMKSGKEIRVLNSYFSDSKSYIYGKLNYLSFLRGGIGQQYIVARKPYWGGIQLSALWYTGISLGITKPAYLYILYIDPGFTEYEIREERYDPEKHYTDNIYGRASFLSGITELGFFPGVYVKTGLDFEFGNKNKRPKSLETGAILDISPIPVPVMAYNPKQNFFLSLYISVMFGKRYN